LSDLDRVRQERRKAKQNRNKYTGVGNDGMGGGASFQTSSGSRYGGFGSDSFNGGQDNYGGGGAFSKFLSYINSTSADLRKILSHRLFLRRWWRVQ